MYVVFTICECCIVNKWSCLVFIPFMLQGYDVANAEIILKRREQIILGTGKSFGTL